MPQSPQGRILVETADQLATVTLNGRVLSFSHAVLIHALRDWHVALYQVRPGAGGALSRQGSVSVETVAGNHLTGDVVTEFVTSHGEYLLLTGVGLLRPEAPAQAA